MGKIFAFVNLGTNMVEHKNIARSNIAVVIAFCLIALGCKTANSTNPSTGSQTGSENVISQKEDNRQQVSDDYSSIFAPIVASLRSKTKVPLRLPTYLATESETNRLYGIIELVSSSAYEIQVAFTQDCSGGNVCHYGTVSGRSTKPGEAGPKGRPVSLANGHTGYFIDATCGATCSDSTFTWDDHGYRYTIGLKAEKLETLKKVAASAIVR